MASYKITWEIDIDASSPREAALKAQAAQQTNRPGYWVGTFTVNDGDQVVNKTIDLDDPEATITESCPKCGTPVTREDAITEDGEDEEEGRTFYYCSQHCFETH